MSYNAHSHYAVVSDLKVKGYGHEGVALWRCGEGWNHSKSDKMSLYQLLWEAYEHVNLLEVCEL